MTGMFGAIHQPTAPSYHEIERQVACVNEKSAIRRSESNVCKT